MRRRNLLIGAGLSAGLTTTTTRSPVLAQTAKRLVLGGSLPLTGNAAETGLNVNNGYLTAASYLNDVLGGVEIAGEKYQIDLKLSDDSSDPARATTILQRQIDQGVEFFLGSFGSNIVLPTAAIVDRARKIMVQTGGGSDQIFTQGFKNIFGMYPRASRQFDSVAKFFATLEPKPRTVSIVSTNDGYGRTQMQGAAASCQAQGIQVLEKYELPEKITDVSSVLTAVRANTPDVLICTLHDQEALLLTRQMVATDTNVKMVFQGLGPQLASFREAMGPYANGLTTMIYWDERVPFKDKFFGSAETFGKHYRSKFTRPLAYHTAGAAACVLTYVLAMQAANSMRTPAVREALAAADFETFYARIKFTPQGDGDPISLGAMVGQVQKGNVDIVFPTEGRTAQPTFPVADWRQKA